MSAQAGPSTSPGSIISPDILLFASGVLAVLDLWPALNIAVSEQWGGPDSAEKKTWMGSVIVDEFESRASFLPNSASSSSTGARVDPKTATDPPLDEDDLGDLLNQIMSDEFDANIEDGSIELVTSDIVRLWRDILSPPAPGAPTPEERVAALQRKAASVQKSGVSNATKGAGPELGSDDSGDDESGDDDDEGGMDVDEAPQLVPREPKDRVEPVVDEDGFELVQKGGRKSGR